MLQIPLRMVLALPNKVKTKKSDFISGTYEYKLAANSGTFAGGTLMLASAVRLVVF